jgi:hypothetical protein
MLVYMYFRALSAENKHCGVWYKAKKYSSEKRRKLGTGVRLPVVAKRGFFFVFCVFFALLGRSSCAIGGKLRTTMPRHRKTTPMTRPGSIEPCPKWKQGMEADFEEHERWSRAASRLGDLEAQQLRQLAVSFKGWGHLGHVRHAGRALPQSPLLGRELHELDGRLAPLRKSIVACGGAGEKKADCIVQLIRCCASARARWRSGSVVRCVRLSTSRSRCACGGAGEKKADCIVQPTKLYFFLTANRRNLKKRLL